MMTTTVKALTTDVGPIAFDDGANRTKVAIVGAGSIGTAIAYTLLVQRICTDIALIDKDEPLAKGEMLDMKHAILYLGNANIQSSSDYEIARGSKICVVTVGRTPSRASQKSDVVKGNIEIFREIIPSIASVMPDAILVVCSYPVDVMTYVAYKLSNFPSHRVLGSGTILESAQFKVLVAEKLKVNPNSVDCYVIGEQGRYSIPVYSALGLIGIRLREVNPSLGNPDDPEDWREMYEEVVCSADEVVNLKACASWGMALSMGRIVKGILGDVRECLPVSTYIKGCRHGADKDVFMSLPCILGRYGVQAIVRLNLSEDEKRQIQKSANRLHDMQRRFFLNVNTEAGDTSTCASGVEIEEVSLVTAPEVPPAEETPSEDPTPAEDPYPAEVQEESATAPEDV